MAAGRGATIGGRRDPLNRYDFARFLGATDRWSAVEGLLSAGQGPANARGLAWRNEMAGRGPTPATIAPRLAALALV